jgi:hypothetical protein
MRIIYIKDDGGVMVMLQMPIHKPSKIKFDHGFKITPHF